jgi:hypothetical protein
MEHVCHVDVKRRHFSTTERIVFVFVCPYYVVGLVGRKTGQDTDRRVRRKKDRRRRG